ncbi:hypothetical protein J2853_004522 [Streptosporangium lutulentum]|uniref:Uncharacterized protein n=1 Tax=Streptosporangium lutulentum TaxID=1461250 RepID=A0ABT9QEZ0_9ACTN|nr:hypothetical protein [Streptosporangium lutulentum]
MAAQDRAYGVPYARSIRPEDARAFPDIERDAPTG